MNKAILIGNLCSDPELRTGASGVPVCKFTLAVNRMFANKEGVREADFLTIIAFKQKAELCARFLTKGKKCAVTGMIQTRTYDKDGVKHYVTEILADEVEFLSAANPANTAGGKRNDAPAQSDAAEPEPMQGADDPLPWMT